MVQVSRRNWDDSISHCRIHDVLHSLAIKKAKEDNFFTACSKIDEMQNCSQQTRRLAIHPDTGTTMTEPYSELMSYAISNLRSLWCYRSHFMPKVSQLVHLKVLHHEERYVLIDYEPDKFGRLNQLRYFRGILEVKSEDVCSFQKFIGGMRFLQTLDLSEGDIRCDLPDCVWHFKTLRHVMLPLLRLAGPPPSIDLRNIQTLKGVRSRESWETKGVPKLPNLKHFYIKLWKVQRDTITTLLGTQEHLISLEIDYADAPFNIIDMKEFPFHNRLQTLQLQLNWDKKIALDVGMLPIHITRLELFGIFSEVDPMPALEKLENLRYLHLKGFGFHKMCCSTGGFVQLEKLILGYLDEVEEWEIEEGALPMLKYLYLWGCDLLGVPRVLQHLTLLQKLDWSPSRGHTISKTMENEIRSVCKHVPSIRIHFVESDKEKSDEDKSDEEQSDEVALSLDEL